MSKLIQKQPNSVLNQVIAITSLGLLSLIFAEFFSGSSPLWYRTGWGYLFVFPIYLSHSVFYLNVAYHRKTLSLSGFFVLGAMLGLYEGMITRVLWIGYPNESGPIFGTLFDVGWLEYLTLILFWHPTMALLVPTLVFMWLSGETVKGISARNKTPFWVVLAVFGSVFLHVSLASNILVIIESILVHVLIGLILVFVFRKRKIQLIDLILSKRLVVGWFVATVLLVYVPLWFFYDSFTSRPSWVGMMAYWISWLVLIVIYIKGVSPKTVKISANLTKLGVREIVLFGLGIVLGVLILTVVSWLIVPVSLTLYLALPMMGVLFVIFFLIKGLSRIHKEA